MAKPRFNKTDTELRKILGIHTGEPTAEEWAQLKADAQEKAIELELHSLRNFSRTAACRGFTREQWVTKIEANLEWQRSNRLAALDRFMSETPI